MSPAGSETLYLVDGSGYIFRAYYAIRPLSNSQGLPTNALYGFTTMLLKLIKQEKPDHLAVVFDAGRKTFRNDVYPDYKANRLEPPEDLIPQFPYFRRIVEALNIPCLELQNFEADDVIATLAHKLEKKKLKTVIVTGDKDLMQLVNDQVTLLDTMRDRKIGRSEVKERFGVTPEQVPDILGLAGDSSDNIPGVPGVGEKTAMKLIQEYGSIESLNEHADEIKGKLGEKIRAHTEKAVLFKELTTVKDDVPVDYDWDNFKLADPDPEKIRSLFTELEFHSLMAELAPQKALSCEGYQLIQTTAALQEMMTELEQKGAYAIDTETSSLDALQAELVGIACCAEEGKAYYVPVAHAEQPAGLDRKVVCEILKPFLARTDLPQYGQNIKYDFHVLNHHGLPLGAVAFDTMVAAYCVNPGGSRSLDALSMEYLQHKTITYKEVVGAGKKQISFAEVPLDQALRYSGEDADVTLHLVPLLQKKLRETKQKELFETIEMPLVLVLARMEQNGVKIDTDALQEISKEYDQKLKKLTKQILEEAGEEFNIKSTKQLGNILFEKMKLPVVRRTKTGYSTDIEVLQTLAPDHSIAQHLLDYRALSKLKSTYVDALPKLVHPETERIHTSFNQAIAATGRLSSSNPNLQNIPIRTEEGRRIREAFVADAGCILLAADYSQIELRILAHLSEDEQLLSDFAADRDVHATTAAGLFGVEPTAVSSEQRSVGKTVNFSVLYGQSPYGLSAQLRISVDEAARYIANYYKTYAGVSAYKEKILKQAAERGYVETLFGRRRYFPELESAGPGARANIERMAFNTVFQGTAADIIKRAMIVIDQQLRDQRLESRMTLQVHDELIFEVPVAEREALGALVTQQMESAASLKVPLCVDIGWGQSWAETKS